jgi:hypothetical protein
MLAGICPLDDYRATLMPIAVASDPHYTQVPENKVDLCEGLQSNRQNSSDAQVPSMPATHGTLWAKSQPVVACCIAAANLWA